jgi:tetratricopeptide (TPR) repeat protein
MLRSKSGHLVVAATALAGALWLSRAAQAQIGGVGGMSRGGMDTNRTMNQLKDPTQQAADAYARGAKQMRKAEKEKDPKDKVRLYQKAKDELTKSVNFSPSYDALLALGQVQLALGDTAEAATACHQAQDLKPADAAARSCIDAASGTAPALVQSVPPAAAPATTQAAGAPPAAAATTTQAAGKVPSSTTPSAPPPQR